MTPGKLAVTPNLTASAVKFESGALATSDRRTAPLTATAM
jgi:hypothetical protein